MYLYLTTGTFSTMFGTERSKHPVLIYEPRTSIEIKLAEWREKFWPTTKEGRAELEAKAAAIKEKEDLEKTTRWRVKTWPKRFGRRVGRSIAHFLKHGNFPEKEAVPYVSPFAKLEGLNGSRVR